MRFLAVLLLVSFAGAGESKPLLQIMNDSAQADMNGSIAQIHALEKNCPAVKIATYDGSLRKIDFTLRWEGSDFAVFSDSVLVGSGRASNLNIAAKSICRILTAKK